MCELWVRSQNKKLLEKVDTVMYSNITAERKYTEHEYNYRDGHFIHSSMNTLGEYETEERALEVLDEIHRLLVPQISDLMRKIQKKDLSPKDIYNVYAIENTMTGQVDIREIQTLVYQMPKE